MFRTHTSLLAAAALGLLLPVGLSAQSFGGTGTTSVSVSIATEAALSVGTSTTALTQGGGQFSDFTGTTNLTYKVRTTKGSGSGTITAQVTADFTGNGPSVGSPAAGDSLAYTCTVASPGTACSGSQTALTSGSTPVASFGSNARSAKAGNSTSLNWTLTNDPQYETGTYSATVTFTISAS